MRYSPQEIAQLLNQKFSPNAEQSAVISAPMEPLLVVAGAGAGKTETMAARVVWLVANGIVRPDQILGLTFTRKAAQELRHRIRQRLLALARNPEFTGPNAAEIREAIRISDPDVSTYDSYAGTILRTYGLLLPVETGASIIDESQLTDLVNDIVTVWPERFDRGLQLASVVNDVLDLHGEMANHVVAPEAVLDESDRLAELLQNLPKGPRARKEFTQAMEKFLATCSYRKQLVEVVKVVRQEMQQQGVLDFAQQMSLAAQLVSEHAAVGEAERSKYRVVLLDEYQDTGHAQRIFLRALYGKAQDPDMAITAVGDPIQSIYAWRGASSNNLDLFRTDFPLADGQPAPVRELLTSWRNPNDILGLANVMTAPLRNTNKNALEVPLLQPAPSASPGEIRLAFTETSVAEYEWAADQFRNIFTKAYKEGKKPPTSAVLVTRNRDSLPMLQALTKVGVPAEIVNVGGLLTIPEVQDVWCMLRIIADPLDGGAALRLLTGPRINLGAKDLVTLWKRARHLRGDEAEQPDKLLDTAAQMRDNIAIDLSYDPALEVGLGDAIDDPGTADRYTPAAYQHLTQLRADIRRLRKRLGQPLPELVAEVERTLGVDVEVEARLDPAAGALVGRQHLDAFADVVSNFAAGRNPSLQSLLNYLELASGDGSDLPAGEVGVRENCVQIITVHGAKGLEWEIIAVPNLTQGEFPATRGRASWVGSSSQIPTTLRGDRTVQCEDGSYTPGVPIFHDDAVADRSAFMKELDAHKKSLTSFDQEESRRLMYVAVTRAEKMLLLSGHAWRHGATLKTPSPYLQTAYEWLQQHFASLTGGEVDPAAVQEITSPSGGTLAIDEWWMPTPEFEKAATREDNPLAGEVNTALWPQDPLQHSPHIRSAHAELMETIAVQEAGEAAPAGEFSTDVDVLLAEYQQKRSGADTRSRTVRLPSRLTASQIVALKEDPQDFARRLRRPIPYKPNRYARRGTEFHTWVEDRLAGKHATLLDIEDFVASADDIPEPRSLTGLKESFQESEWGRRATTMVEVPFDVSLGNVVINGRIDAVFQDDQDHYTVVDWKTGAQPRSRKERDTKALQLAVYRVAFHRLINAQRQQQGQPEIPLTNIRAAFYYVAHNKTLWLDDLSTPAQIDAMIAQLSASSGG